MKSIDKTESSNEISNGEMFLWEGLQCLRITDHYAVVANIRNRYVIASIYNNAITIEDGTEFDSVFHAMNSVRLKTIANQVRDGIAPKDTSYHCPACNKEIARDFGGWNNPASAENGKKGGRPAEVFPSLKGCDYVTFTKEETSKMALIIMSYSDVIKPG